MDAFWPILILWVVLTVLGSRKKKARDLSPVPQQPRTPHAAARGQGGFLEEMKRALEEMQRAAEEEERRRRAAAGIAMGEGVAAEPLPGQRAQLPRGSRPAAKSRAQGQPPARRQPVVRPMLPQDDDADMSSEDPTVASLEGRDYDTEIEQVVAERAKAADRGIRAPDATSELSSAQLARRAHRPAVAIGSSAQHAEWHKRVDAPPASGPAKAPPSPRSRLSRWADGSLRSALVLSEILGRPPGAR